MSKLRQKYSEKTIESAINEYLQSGNSFNKVGEKYGMTGGNLRHWLIKKGFNPRKQSTGFSAKLKAEAVRKYQDKSLSLKSIADEFGVSRRTILDWAKESGVKPIRFEERRGYDDEIRKKAIDLYVKNELNCIEIGKKLNLCSRSVFDWIPKDVLRTRSETTILVVKKGKQHNRFRGWYNSRFGKIMYEGSYELQRIKQLEKDRKVSMVVRCQDAIPYNDKSHYNPDFKVFYSDGRIDVEEIKPFTRISYGKNRDKYRAAKLYYKNSVIKYKVVTEILLKNIRPSKKMVVLSRCKKG